MRIDTLLGPLAAKVIAGPPPVAVLWHSMFTDSRSWKRVTRELSQKRTLVLIDGWSFGDSADLGRVIDITRPALTRMSRRTRCPHY